VKMLRRLSLARPDWCSSMVECTAARSGHEAGGPAGPRAGAGEPREDLHPLGRVEEAERRVAGAAGGGVHHVAAEERGPAVGPRDVVLDVGAPDPRVGDDGIEVLHQLRLGECRQRRERRREVAGVHLAVVGRVHLGVGAQRPQRVPLMDLQLRGRHPVPPAHPGERLEHVKGRSELHGTPPGIGKPPPSPGPPPMGRLSV
jgi:hypothetical protein